MRLLAFGRGPGATSGGGAPPLSHQFHNCLDQRRNLLLRDEASRRADLDFEVRGGVGTDAPEHELLVAETVGVNMDGGDGHSSTSFVSSTTFRPAAANIGSQGFSLATMITSPSALITAQTEIVRFSGMLMRS